MNRYSYVQVKGERNEKSLQARWRVVRELRWEDPGGCREARRREQSVGQRHDLQAHARLHRRNVRCEPAEGRQAVRRYRAGLRGFALVPRR